MDEKEFLEIIEQAARYGWTELNLSGKGIESLPPEIGKLTKLTRLYMGGNRITSLPPQVGQLTNLAMLKLEGNGITSLPAELCELTKLKRLDLRNNGLRSLTAEVSQLANLTRLNLEGNGINSLPPELCEMAKLTRLDLRSNGLTSLPTEIANLENLTTLDLSENQLTSLPGEIGDLKNLTKLALSFNELRSLPAQVGNLKNMTRLFLQRNKLTLLPAEIGNLENLTTLSLRGNQLMSVPKELGQLTNLEEFNLARNQLTSVPKELGRLRNLKALNLAGNQLTSVPKELGQLTNLKELDLRYNKLSSLPKEIVDWGMEIRWEKWETGSTIIKSGAPEIYLRGNPLESPPIEIVKQGTKAVKNYFESFVELKAGSRIYEAKMMVVGEGEVGKTCLMKRLIEPDKAIDKNELTTEGIEINQWMIQTPKTRNFRVNFWDFGGQEIYHATHQFFLTKRSLYLFVWAARTDEDLTSFDYWLNVVRLLSDNSPVIVVLNKIDNRIKSIDEQSLQSKFSNIKLFEKVSALKGTGIKVLVENIKKQVDQLPHIGDVLPTVWVIIRRQLESLAKNYISYDEYKVICKEFGQDEERAEFLSRYYHDLGVFLHFLDNPVLREIVFLKPDWATNAVYKVVDTREIQESYGKFHFEQLKGIWADYPEDKYAHLLELMKKFELCFEIPKTQTYIVPELLRPGKPELEWDYTDNLMFEYRYEFMPAGIITRFIVRTHDICKEEIYWKNGVILKREKTEALIVSERLNRKIRIWISGKNRKELLAIIRREIDYIHKSLNYPDVKEMIPCICSECARAEQPYFYDYKTLCRFRAKGKIACEKSTEDVSIEKLLGEYERPEDKEEMERRRREEDIHVEVKPHIEFKPTIEQKHVIEQRPPVESPKKRKWYRTWKVIWAIIAGIFLILGGIWTAIQIYEHFHNSEIKPKTEQKQNENKAVEDEINEINPP